MVLFPATTDAVDGERKLRSPVEETSLVGNDAAAALLTTWSVPARGLIPTSEEVSDLKVTLTVQVWPGATAEVQVLVCEKWTVSERVMPVTVSGIWPVEVMVKTVVALSPIRIGPKRGDDGVMVAAAMLGEMVKVCELETGGPDVVDAADMVMLAVPIVVTSDAGTLASNELLLTNVVGSGVPFHRAMLSGGRLVPISVRTKAPLPAGMLSGEREFRKGPSIKVVMKTGLEGVGLGGLVTVTALLAAPG